MRIEVNIGVTPLNADAKRKNMAITTACRRAAELLYEDMQEFSFITHAYLLTEKCDGSQPARLIVTTHLDPFDTAERRGVVMYRDQSQDSLFCSMLDNLHGDEDLVTHWPEITNLYAMMREGWDVPARVVSEVQGMLLSHMRKKSRKRIQEYFETEDLPVPPEFVYVKFLEGEETYLSTEDVPAIRKAILSLDF